jgi:hypothetical protein
MCRRMGSWVRAETQRRREAGAVTVACEYPQGMKGQGPSASLRLCAQPNGLGSRDAYEEETPAEAGVWKISRPG